MVEGALAANFIVTQRGTSFLNGFDLMTRCEATGEGEPKASPALYNTCIGYLSGIVDAEDAHAGLGHKQLSFCVPKSVYVEELRKTFLGWMRTQPPFARISSAGSLVIAAFSESWPCG
jgi:hypothetical protein